MKPGSLIQYSTGHQIRLGLLLTEASGFIEVINPNHKKFNKILILQSQIIEVI